MILALFAVFVAKVLSLAGIGGLISGLFIKRWPIAALAGVAFGGLDTIILASVRVTGVDFLSLVMAILAAASTASLGWWIRGRKRPE
jgi:hypothetical protein